ncbi:Retrotransposon-derived protein PEG10 [Zancudomyces culisetae]|uniref:Retrotransposon-derived protein PEG10 n=1 Tax=Zancudomyces culisetae TaxID=1213189 RepID=A0A1R1PCI0_ZANCU|nr:Retrotransposon-derived protein PEG10 [Zancudomyces culisetae]|eukprot:OMH78677.1 Retrotransposon-derived protein PEG10 [Zancudomyces culisetae]
MSDTHIEDLDAPVMMTVREYNELHRMFNRLGDLQSRVDSLANPGHVQSMTVSREPRVADPEYYNGNRDHLRNFISQVNLVIEAQPSRFPSDKQKVVFVSTFLRGAAFSWLQPYLESRTPVPMLTDFELFTEELHRVFGNPHQASTAERQLRRLRQTNSAVNYATDFRRLSTLTNWNDSALCSQYYEGLKDEVKDQLARFDRAENLNELIDLSIKVDNRLFERQLERTHRSRFAFNQPTIPRSDPTSPHQPHTQPMEIDGTSTRRPPITPEERQRRRDNNLCLYCGNPDHIIAICPRRPQNRSTITLAATTTQENSPAQNV